ncbi:hypothetical protein GCM10027288_06090 [Bordetella tumbae]
MGLGRLAGGDCLCLGVLVARWTGRTGLIGTARRKTRRRGPLRGLPVPQKAGATRPARNQDSQSWHAARKKQGMVRAKQGRWFAAMIMIFADR